MSQRAAEAVGLTRADLEPIIKRHARSLFENWFATAARSGVQTPPQWRDLQQASNALGLVELNVHAIVKRDTLAFFKSHLAILERQPLTQPFDANDLAELQQFLGIAPTDSRRILDPFYAARRQSEARAGLMPTIPTNKLLESSELCYFDAACHFSRVTAKGTHKTVSGQITITNKRIIFTAETGGFEYSAAKIVRLEGGARRGLRAN